MGNEGMKYDGQAFSGGKAKLRLDVIATLDS